MANERELSNFHRWCMRQWRRSNTRNSALIWAGLRPAFAASMLLNWPANAQSIAFVEIDILGTAMSGAIMDAAREGSEEHEPSITSRPKPVHGDARRLSYAASATRTRANVASFADRSRVLDAQGAAGLEKLFAEQDVMALVEAELRKVGLTRTNLADAYAVWWTSAWLGVQGRNEDLPRAQMQAVKRQAVNAMLAMPQVLVLDDAGKQRFAEDLLIQAMLIGASVDAAKEEPALMGRTKAAIEKGARAAGVDLSALALGNDGFRLTSR